MNNSKGLLLIFSSWLMILIPSYCLSKSKPITYSESIPNWIFPKPFKYDAKDLPDPFIPFIKSNVEKTNKNKPSSKGPLTPLQKISPTQLKLVGIIFSSKKKIPPMALVELPNKKAYILKIGTHVGPNGGKVSFINNNSVTIIEPITNPFGEKRYKKTILKLHTREGD